MHHAISTYRKGAPALSQQAAPAEGLCQGTTVLTLDGEMPVEHLTPGDRIITRDSGVAVLRAVTCDTRDIAAIRIRAGSLGHTRPDRDMLLPPGTRIHIRDWRAAALFGTSTAMIPAHRLVDGEFISVTAPLSMTIYHLEFDGARILYADGLEIAAS